MIGKDWEQFPYLSMQRRGTGASGSKEREIRNMAVDDARNICMTL